MFTKIRMSKQFILPISITVTFLFSSIISFAKPILDIQQWQTSNGARVFFVQTPEVPMVEINVVFAAGSSRDADKPGVAQLTNEMLNQGTTTLNADQIAASFDNVGAQYNDAITRDMALITFQSLTDPKYLNPALQTLANLISTSNFPVAAFQRTQKQTLNAITQQQQTPGAVAKNAFYAAVYGSQPYGHPVLGTSQSVTVLTPADLQNFYKQYYVAKNAMITIVGAIPKTQAESIANQLMRALPEGAVAPALPIAQPLTQALQQKIKFPSEQTNIFMGQVGINYNDPNYFPLYVGNYLLGASPLTSRLFNEVREKRGLAYAADSAFAPMSANGPFVIVLQSRTDQANQALQVVQTTLNDFVKNGPSEKELITTKKKIVNGFPLSLVGSDAISNGLVVIGFYNLPLNYLDTYTDKVNAVTVDQVKQAFQNTIQPNKMVTVLVGDP